MAKKLDIGVLVVCVRVHNPDYSMLLGEVGTITEQVGSFYGFITGADWIVDFPGMVEKPCPNCGKSHGSKWPMASFEIVPLEDPDQHEEVTEEQTLDEVVEELCELEK